MGNITNRIKQIARRYITPVALAGAITFYAVGCNQVDNKIKKEVLALSEVKEFVQKKEEELIKSKANNYDLKLKKAQNYLENCIRNDKYLDEQEQKELFELYKNNLEYADKYREIIKVDKSTKRLYSLLDKNLHNFDYGIPELEKQFKKEGLELKVEKISTPDEKWLSKRVNMIPSMIIPTLFVLGLVLSAMRPESNYRDY